MTSVIITSTIILGFSYILVLVFHGRTVEDLDDLLAQMDINRPTARNPSDIPYFFAQRRVRRYRGCVHWALGLFGFASVVSFFSRGCALLSSHEHGAEQELATMLNWDTPALLSIAVFTYVFILLEVTQIKSWLTTPTGSDQS